MVKLEQAVTIARTSANDSGLTMAVYNRGSVHVPVYVVGALGYMSSDRLVSGPFEPSPVDALGKE